MSNRFGTDILIQAPDPKKAALFYVNQLGFEISDNNPKMIGLHGKHINLARLVKNGCEIVKDEPDFPRCYVKDPFGLIYNLTS